MSDTEERTLQDRLRSRAWDDRQHRQLREKAAARLDQLEPLLSAATTFIEEAESMGWGKTSETALPGSYDTLVKAVREVKG